MSIVNGIEKDSEANLLKFELGLPPPWGAWCRTLLGLDEVEKVYSKTKKLILEKKSNAAPGFILSDASLFSKYALESLGVAFIDPNEQLKKLRELKGPLIFVSNHPFGAIDGLIFIYFMSQVRSDFRFIANSELKIFPELRSILCSVEILHSKTRQSTNRHTNFLQLRALMSYLKGGGLVGIFPAGKVAISSEDPWNDHLGLLVKWTQATVVPIFIDGRNSLLVRWVGGLIPSLQLPLLVREMLQHRRQIHYQVREVLTPKEMSTYADAQELTAFIRSKTLP